MILITQERHKGAGMLFTFAFSCGPIIYYVQLFYSDQNVKFAVFFLPCDRFLPIQEKVIADLNSGDGSSMEAAA